MTLTRLSEILATTITAVAFAGSALAATVSPTETLPADLRLGTVESASARLYAENTSVAVASQSVVVDFLASGLTPGTVNNGRSNPGAGMYLGAGVYDSFLIHFDPDGGGTTSGAFTFASNIVAIILSNGNSAANQANGRLNLSDAYFGGSGTTYEDHYGRRTESNDTFTLVSANQISFNLTTNATHIDNIRVLTEVAPVPLPAGALLLLTGFGGLALMRRRG